MKASRTPSAKPEKLTATEQGKREKNLAHLVIIAHDHGVDAAIEELRRMQARARSSPTAPATNPASSTRATKSSPK